MALLINKAMSIYSFQSALNVRVERNTCLVKSISVPQYLMSGSQLTRDHSLGPK